MQGGGGGFRNDYANVTLAEFPQKIQSTQNSVNSKIRLYNTAEFLFVKIFIAAGVISQNVRRTFEKLRIEKMAFLWILAIKSTLYMILN